MSNERKPEEGYQPTVSHNYGPPAPPNEVWGNQLPPAQNVWTQNALVPPQQLFPKKRKRWGIPEVINSFFILICLQIIIGIIASAQVMMSSIATGGDNISNEALEKSMTDALLSPQMILISSAAMYFAWVFMMWYSTRFRGRRSFLKDFWVQVKWKDIPIGLAVGLGLTAFVQGVSYLLVALGFDLSAADNTEIFRNQDAFWRVILMVGLAGIVGPVMEELFFRGFLLQALIRHFRRGNVHEPRSVFGLSVQRHNAGLFNAYLVFRNWCYRQKYTLSIIISSILFGFAHFPFKENATPEELFGAFLIVGITGTLGLIFAIITVKTRRIGINIFAHIFYNSTVAIMALTMF